VRAHALDPRFHIRETELDVVQPAAASIEKFPVRPGAAGRLDQLDLGIAARAIADAQRAIGAAAPEVAVAVGEIHDVEWPEQRPVGGQRRRHVGHHEPELRHGRQAVLPRQVFDRVHVPSLAFAHRRPGRRARQAPLRASPPEDGSRKIYRRRFPSDCARPSFWAMQVTKLLETGSVQISDYRCTAGPGDLPAAEEHRAFTLSFVRRGSFGCRTRGRTFELVPGAFLVGHPGDEYLCTHDHHICGDECLSFAFAPDAAERIGRGTEVWRAGALPPLAPLMVLGELADAAHDRRCDTDPSA
jgi:hypothetical protein